MTPGGRDQTVLGPNRIKPEPPLVPVSFRISCKCTGSLSRYFSTQVSNPASIWMVRSVCVRKKQNPFDKSTMRSPLFPLFVRIIGHFAVHLHFFLKLAQRSVRALTTLSLSIYLYIRIEGSLCDIFVSNIGSE